MGECFSGSKWLIGGAGDLAHIVAGLARGIVGLLCAVCGRRAVAGALPVDGDGAIRSLGRTDRYALAEPTLLPPAVLLVAHSGMRVRCWT